MTTAGTIDAPKSNNKRVGLLVLLLILLALIAYRINDGAGRGGVASLLKPPRTIALALGEELDLKAGGVQRWQWEVSSSQPTCRLTGHIQVTDGGNRDVKVAVMSADDYANWINGHPAQAYYSTDKTTAITLDVTTKSAGPKVLAISNAFSVFTAKRIQLRSVQVVCQ
jgi:hypothetical protein